jgi:hypothetical protein
MMTRASRKIRLPTASAVGKKAEWALNTEQWAAVETDYGFTLDTDTRTNIGGIVNKYFENEPMARDAPFVDDMVAWLNGLKAASAAFLDAYGSSTGLPKAKKQIRPAKQKSDKTIEEDAKEAAANGAMARQGRHYVECLLNDKLAEMAGESEPLGDVEAGQGRHAPL